MSESNRDDVVVWRPFARPQPHPAAPDLLGRLLSLADRPQGHRRTEQTTRSTTHQAELEATYCDAIRRNPKDAVAHLRLGNVLSDLGRLQEAAAAHREAIHLDPTQTKAHTALGATLLRLGRLHEAETALREAIRQDPDDGDAFVALGAILRRRHRIDPEGET